jgi:hypothetical protein
MRKGRTARSVMLISFRWIALLEGNDRSILLGKEDLCSTQHKVLQRTKLVE